MASQSPGTSLARAPAMQEARLPSVLIVDQDKHTLVHCAAMLGELGYPFHGVTTPRDALAAFGRDDSIQIILANVQIPDLRGFALIEEARVRAGDSRPIAAIMLAEHATTDMAIRGLHVEAVDLLAKPLAFDAYSTAMRRAMRYLAMRRPAPPELHDINGFGEQLSRLVEVLEGKGPLALPVPDVPATAKDIAATLRMMIASRSQRGRYFPAEMFADPAWDILLDLTRAEIENQQVSVSSVCIAASVPMSTALRWVKAMTEAGLLRRWTDPKDRRRDLIALTPATAGHMRDYLTAVYALIRKM